MQVRSISAFVLALVLVGQVFSQEERVRRPAPPPAAPAAAPDVAEEPAKKDGDEEKPKPEPKPEPEVEPRPEPPKLPTDPRLIWLHLMDGAVISGRLSIDEIDVETNFGPLKVPVGSIRSFTPGMVSHPELVSQIGRLVEQLGSSDFGERELAQKQLLKIGLPARDAVRARQDDRDTERRTRIKTILTQFDELEESLEEEEEQTPLSGEAEEAAGTRGAWRSGGPVRQTIQISK